jgi:hypothetical protein
MQKINLLDTLEPWYTIIQKIFKRTNMMNTRVFFPAASTCIGILWVVVGLSKYGWYVDEKPASGFFPILIGGLLTVIGILAVLSERKLSAPEFVSSYIHPLLAAVSVVFFALFIGFFPALTLYVFGWLRWYEKYSMRFSLIVTAITIALMYGIFSMWLRVPFPIGQIFEMIQS